MTEDGAGKKRGLIHSARAATSQSATMSCDRDSTFPLRKSAVT
jgi:hypothetical protein